MKRKLEDSPEGEDCAKKRKQDEGDECPSDEGESSSSEESIKVESLVQGRERRANAGNKMALLMESAEQDDEFYSSTYGGGFLEDDADDAYESPVESDHDEVDSDFDRSEEEDEPISDVEEKEKPKKRSKYQEPKLSDSARRKSLLDKNKKWVMARMGGPTVAANKVSPETQAELLEEAKETERMNVASLQRYEQFELEKKKKREKSNVIRSLKPPFIRSVDGPDGKWIIVPDVKIFHKPERKVKHLCAVTSRPAKYLDPVTGLPYATPAAFKMIREKYIEYLKSVKNNDEVAAWLAENS